MGAAQHRGSVTRFPSKEIETDRVVPLADGHPALTEGRTIFSKTVTPSRESPRFLISGHSNTKLGKTVLKGPLAGSAIYQLSLEERATCPRSCQQWTSCYGNSMPFARRHTPDADFERLLIAEITTLCRTHPDGLLIRLHVLGDFYSVEYVYIWAALLNQFPQLNVFGYTSRRTDDADPETVRIARAIKALTDGAWSRFAIRTSGDGNPERSRAIVVDEDPGQPNVIVCPAQTKATEACASCGLCWAPGFRDKTIAFLRHGRKLRGPADKPANDVVSLTPAPRQSEATPVLKVVASAASPAPTFASGKVNKAEEARRLVAAALEKLGPTMPGGLCAKDLKDETGLSYERIVTACGHLSKAGKARWTYARGKASKVLLPVGGEDAPPAFSENQQRVIAIMRMATIRQAAEPFTGLFSMMRSVIATSAGVPNGSMGEVIDALVRKRVLEIVTAGTPHAATTFRLVGSAAVLVDDLPRLKAAMAGLEPKVVRFDQLDAPAPAPLAKAIPDYRPAPAPKPPVVIPIRTKVSRPASAPSADDLPAQVSPDALPKGLIARKPGQCAYPTNSPAVGRGEETTFCCEPTMGKLQYCEAHARAMWPARKAK